MTEQRNLFDNTTTSIKKRPRPVPTGPALRDKGIKKSADHAEAVEHGWQDDAIECIRNYPEKRFRTEEVRAWAYANGLTEPPSHRAWGGVIVRAKNLGIIKHAGYEAVSNPKAHSTPASIWVK